MTAFTATCLLGSCATGKERRVTRWEQEHILEEVQQRLDKSPQAMRTRRKTVEHPFGVRLLIAAIKEYLRLILVQHALSALRIAFRTSPMPSHLEIPRTSCVQ